MNKRPAADIDQTSSPSHSRLPIKLSSSSALNPRSVTSTLLGEPTASLASKQFSRSTSLTSSTSTQILAPSLMHDKPLISGTKFKGLPKRVVRQPRGLEPEIPSSIPCRPMSPPRPSITSSLTSKSEYIGKTTRPNKPSNVSKLPVPDPRPSKRTLFSSKLDPLVLTSKLLPVSSRTKVTSKSPEPSISILPVAPTTITNASRNGGAAVILDSPPNKGTIKPRHIIKIKQELPGSLNIIKSPKPDKSAVDEKKSSLRVSFSNAADGAKNKRVDGSITEHETETAESSNKLWGSWNKKRTLQVPTIHEDPDKSSSTPSMSSVAEDGKDGKDGKQKEKHKSLAPHYLKSLISGSNDSMSEASHVPLRRSSSMSGCPASSQARPSGSTGNNLLTDPSSSTPSTTKKRFSPLLVGSPTLPKARLETETAVERVNSLGSSGKWANRSRVLSVDLTRRRTIHPVHPLFSFERPSSAGAASIRKEKPDSIKDEELNEAKKQRRATLPATKPTDECLISEKNLNHTNVDGIARLDQGASLPKGPLLRPLLGAQSLGRFDFEASTSTSMLPRRTERSSVLASPISITKFISSPSRLSKLGLSGSHDALASSNPESVKDTGFHEYIAFCMDLRAMLSDDDWSSFMNYARRFDLHILTPDVLLQRVKKLIDGRRNVDPVKRDKMYERFSKIVHDSICQ